MTRAQSVFLWAAIVLLAGTSHAAPILGDADGDTDIDLVDFARFANCFTGTNPSGPQSCGVFNFSPDVTIGSADFRRLMCGFSGPGVIVDAVTVDSPDSPVVETNIVLTGETAGAAQVQVTGGAQTVTAATVDCAFNVLVPLRTNAVNRLYVSGLFGFGTASAPTAVAVTQDSQPPSLFVDFPAGGATITTPATDVAGRVSDALSGFDNLRVKVAVNGGSPVLATLDIGVGANGTFFLSNVALDPGSNTINVSSVDGLNNFIERQITVNRVDPPAGAALMEVFSGNAQSAAIRTPLPQPIQVRLSNAKGAPLEGKVVNFAVTRSDGRLAAQSSGLFPGQATVQAFTDDQGVARAFWRVGSDAGRGNNRVEVTSESVVGTTVFCASATAGSATQINIGSGNSQRVEVGSPAPEPLNIWINDSCNPVSGLAVTFTVRQGGGKIGGLDEVTVPTDGSGHAEVVFTLGPDGGNNIVEASFPGNPNPPGVFSLFGISRDQTQPTTFTGLVQDNAGEPIQNATCALVVNGATLPFVRSDLNGVFRFDNLTVSGLADIHVAGASATHVGGADGVDVPLNSFPSLRYTTVIVQNAENTLPSPVLLPRLDASNVRVYSVLQDTELTIAGMVGLKMIVKAGSMKIRSGGQFVPAPHGTLISLNQVHHDDVPMPLPDGAAPPFAWTVQPGGSLFDPPITVFYPNMSGLPAGAIANFLSFNHDTGKFEIIASGHVTADGTTIVTDPGAGISLAGWGCNCPPYAVTGQCCHCNAPCQTCVVGACVPTGDGVSCGGTCCSAGQSCCDGTCCGAEQECCNGSCVAPGQTCCDDGHTCPPEEACCQGGCCVQGAECCENGCCQAGQQCCGGNCVSAQSICCDNGVECFPEFPLCCGSGCCVADGVCCNDECQIPGSECCGDGRVCSPPTPRCCGETCCAENVECCNGVCAAPGAHCCDDANFCSGDTPQCCVETCCAADGVCCDGVCGTPGAVCCEGPGFCPAETPQCCDKTCCASDGVCCRGECLPSGTACCQEGNTCQGDEPVCCHGTCCTSTDVCCEDGCNPEGSVCCDGGRTCPAESPQCCGEQNCCPADALCCGDSGLCCPAETIACCGPSCCGVDESCCNEECHPAPGTCCDDGTFCSGLGAVCCSGGCAAEGSVCCESGRSCPGDAPLCCGLDNCCPADALCCGESGLCCPPLSDCCGDAACCGVDEYCCNDSCHPAPGVCCEDGAVCPGLDAVCCGANCCAADDVCCNGTCFPPGTGCCPSGTCPPPNSQCCGQTCCGATDVCCGNGSCCDAGTTCCGDSGCCTAGEICCNGTCVPPSGCCPNGTCSPPNSQCCGDTCCGTTDVCCENGTCCDAGTVCCGAEGCCAADEVCCNGQCFPPGTGCCDNGTCTPPNTQCCGDSCCGPTDVCCGNGSCCGAGTVCCGDEGCCTANQMCCNGVCLPAGSPCP